MRRAFYDLPEIWLYSKNGAGTIDGLWCRRTSTHVFPDTPLLNFCSSYSVPDISAHEKVYVSFYQLLCFLKWLGVSKADFLKVSVIRSYIQICVGAAGWLHPKLAHTEVKWVTDFAHSCGQPYFYIYVKDTGMVLNGLWK